jgi:hypothetical protein
VVEKQSKMKVILKLILEIYLQEQKLKLQLRKKTLMLFDEK